MKRFVVPFVALLAAALIGGVASVGLWEAVDDDTAPAAATATATVNRPVAVKSGSVADIYEQTIPGVVEITAQSSAAGQPGGAAPPRAAAGSSTARATSSRTSTSSTAPARSPSSSTTAPRSRPTWSAPTRRATSRC